MYLDLNVAWDNRQAASAVARTAATLGYSGIAFNISLDLSAVSPSEATSVVKSHVCPIDDDDIVSLRNDFASARTAGVIRPHGYSRATGSSRREGGVESRLFAAKRAFDELRLPALRGCGSDAREEHAHQFLFLRRLTVIINHPNNIGLLNNLSRHLSDSYDLLAVRVLDERTWMCVLKEGEFDIVSFDLSTDVLPFKLRRAQLGLAVSRGCFFEICVGPSLRDSNRRRAFFANVDPLVRFVAHDKIILTSGARDGLELRGPHELANIADILNVSSSHFGGPKACVSDSAIAALYKGACRRSGGGFVGWMPNSSCPLIAMVEEERKIDFYDEENSASGETREERKVVEGNEQKQSKGKRRSEEASDGKKRLKTKRRKVTADEDTGEQET